MQESESPAPALALPKVISIAFPVARGGSYAALKKPSIMPARPPALSGPVTAGRSISAKWAGRPAVDQLQGWVGGLAPAGDFARADATVTVASTR